MWDIDMSGWYEVNENLIYKYEHWPFEFCYIPWIFCMEMTEIIDC